MIAETLSTAPARVARVPRSATIELSRDRALWRDRLASYRVLIDEREVGLIASGEAHRYSVGIGAHEVKLTAKGVFNRRFTSQPLGVSLSDGETVSLSCKAGGPAIESIFIVFSPHSYIRLQRSK